MTLGFLNSEMICSGYTIKPQSLTISTNQDDLTLTYDNSTISFYVLTNTTSSLDITGLMVEDDGHQMKIYNSSNSTENIVLKHDSSSSSEVNRFYFQSTSDITLTPGQSVDLVYIESAWRNI
jgi:hypothetical protein